MDKKIRIGFIFIALLLFSAVFVIELEFKKLGDKLIAAYEDIASRALPLTLNQEIETVLNERNLNWPKLLDQIVKHQLVLL